jgi:hypothetical protein
MATKKANKGKPTNPRGGGHRPLATTRKTLEGKTLDEQCRAAEHGDSDPEIERLAYLVTIVRQFEERLLRPEYSSKEIQDHRSAAGFSNPALPVLPGEISIWPTRVSGCDPTTFKTVVIPTIAHCLSYLGAWLAKADPKQLHTFAKFLEVRPIEHRKDISPDVKILGPLPADPNLHAALKIAQVGLTHKVPEKPPQTGQGGKKLGASVKVTKVSNGTVAVEYDGLIEGLVHNLVDWPAEERDKWSKRIAPDSNPTDLQKVTNKVFGITRKRGRPKNRKTAS